MALIASRPRTVAAGVFTLAVITVGLYVVLRPSPPPVPEPPPEEIDDVQPDPAPPDPRSTFPTPFRNVKPDIAYVGDARCADCHGEICATYANHPMGRSAEFIGKTSIEKFEGTNRALGGYELRVAKTPDRIVYGLSAKDSANAALPEFTVAANVAIGSGARGRSYLWMEDGAVWQSPVSWFSNEAQWKLFPGFHSRTGGPWPAHTDCLFCHVDRVDPIPRSLNRYREPLFPLQASIGCERCHGPGALHAAERSANARTGKPDTSIVNPKHLPIDLQLSVCSQCHLAGQERIARRGRSEFEFRPGLPFEQFVSVFVRNPNLPDVLHTGSQFEQLERSKCFASGRMTCTSCHDPHASPAPAARPDFYRKHCLTCHKPEKCTAPQAERVAKQDSCVACHMPQGDRTNLAHVSITDHRILRRPAPPKPGSGLAPGESPLVAFRVGPHAPSVEERERDLGIVFARLTTKLPSTAQSTRESVAAMAIDRLTPALARWRGDSDAWVGLGVARGARGEGNEWLAAAKKATKLAPDSEPALSEEASAALALGRFEQATAAATKLIQLNPSATEYRFTRAIALTRQGTWDKAEEDLRWILGKNPLHVQARFLFAVCRHRRGDVAGGQKEAETAAGLVSDFRQREAMLERYRRETR